MYRNGDISEATEVKCPFYSIDVLDNVKGTVPPPLVLGRQSTYAVVAIHLPQHTIDQVNMLKVFALIDSPATLMPLPCATAACCLQIQPQARQAV